MTKRIPRGRNCIFCGRIPVTQEHIVPEWVGKVIKKHPRPFLSRETMYRRLTVGDQVVSERIYQSNNPLDFIAKCVCGRCNSGWMSTIEGKAKPIVSRMILGESVTLSVHDQRAVSAWAALKAIVGRYAHEDTDAAPPEFLRYMFKHQQPPPGFRVWLSAYDGNTPAWYEGHTISAIPHPPDFASARKDLLVSLILGNLAIKVLGVRGRRPVDPPAEYYTRVWLRSRTTRTWPPPLYFTDSILRLYLDMWLQP